MPKTPSPSMPTKTQISDARVLAAYAAALARFEQRLESPSPPQAGSFSWAVEVYFASPHWAALAVGTQKSRRAIYKRYIEAQGSRSISDIRSEDLEMALVQVGRHAAINELKALKPVFAHMKAMRFIAADPAAGIKLEKPKSDGHPTASADEIQAFQDTWPVGTTERLIFDLALYTGAARVDLIGLSRQNINDGLIQYHRVKTGVLAQVPITLEVSRVLDRLPDIAPAFIMTSQNKPFSAAGLGNLFGDAAKAAGMKARLHGLRKAFCVYWAEKGASTHQIAAMAGHLTLAEVERYTRATDRTKLVRLLVTEG